MHETCLIIIHDPGMRRYENYWEGVATKQRGRKGNFYPYKKGWGEKVVTMLNRRGGGGHNKF